MDVRLVVIARFGYRYQGEFARACLDDAGVESALFVDDAGGTHVGLSFSNPARLLVHPDNAARAREILVDAGLLDEPPARDE